MLREAAVDDVAGWPLPNRSMTRTEERRRASSCAVDRPKIPAPTIAMSYVIRPPDWCRPALFANAEPRLVQGRCQGVVGGLCGSWLRLLGHVLTLALR